MDLYSDQIKQLNAAPPNYEKRDHADHSIKAFNSYCGDKFTVFVDSSDRIATAVFHGYGCAVSKASAAILTEYLPGKSWTEVNVGCQKVLDFLAGNTGEIDMVDVRLEDFAVVKNYPGRFECAALVWREVGAYAQQIVTEDC